MKRKAISGIVLMLLLTSMLSSAFNIQPINGVNVASAGDIIIDTSTTWDAGSYTYDTVVITNNATLTLNGTVALNAVNLTIHSGSLIFADALGYPTREGPGAGGAGSYGASGAGYGGEGGDCHSTEGGLSYGSLTEPTDLGSGGGGYGVALGGAGGGAIKIEVQDILTLDGNISANGGNGRYGGYGNNYGGGGSGGSIYIITDILTGSGFVEASGGDGGKKESFYGGGGGAGGRIAIYYQVSTFSGTVLVEGGSGRKDGENGTLLFSALVPPSNQAPDPPILLSQYKTDGTEIPVGDTIAETAGIFKGVVSDPDGDRVKLQVELRRLDEYGGGFNESEGGFKESGWVENGSETIAYAFGLVDGDYHWRARLVDEHGKTSKWVDFGNNDISETDFTVGLIVPPNQEPDASFTYSPESPKAGEETRLDATGSEDPDGQIEYYEWDLDGDGEYDGFTTSPDIYYYWSESGTYRVRLRVTDNRGAIGTFEEDINVQPNSLWEKFKNFLAPSVEELSKSEKRRFEIIKKELHICNYPHNCERYDPDFYWISDDQLLTILKKKIEPQAADLTYETYIIDVLHDMKLADSVAHPSFTTNPVMNKYFDNMAELNVWAEATEMFLEYLLERILKEMGSPMKGFGAEVVLMLPKLCQIGVGIKFLDKTFYRRALWHYFQLRRMGYSSKMAFGSSPIPFKYSNEATRRYFEKLWTEYAPHISGSGGLESDFKQKIIEQLRCLFLSGLEKYKFEPYNIYDLDSPGELRVYDSQGRVTGLVNGEVKEEIPTSAYDHESKTVLIFNSTDSYNCQVIGTNEGIYELTITSVEEGEATSFDATNIPTSTNTTHQYTVDWDALSQGEEGVTLQIDFDGDGVFEQTITADSELTHDEFALQTATTIDFDPDTLNLESEGKVVTVYIELPEGYNVSQIDVSSIRLNGTVPALVKPTEIGDYDSDGILDLMVKFDRASVIALFDGKTVPGNYMIEVTGTWAGIRFEGTVMIRVISPP